MNLVEHATEEARHCACGHDGDCYHFKIIAALEAAEAMADDLASVSASKAQYMDDDPEYMVHKPYLDKAIEALAKFRELTK